MDVIRHDDEWPELILSQSLTAKQRLDYQCGDRFAPQMHRISVRSVEIAIHPRESFAIGDFTGGRKMGARQAAVEVPREKKPPIIGIDMGKTALRRHAQVSGVQTAKLSRSHECERCTHECVRHTYSSNRHNNSNGHSNSYGVRYD